MSYIQTHHNLIGDHTFMFPCIADAFVCIATEQEFLDLLASPERDIYTSKLFLGGGSNLFFAKGTYHGLVIKNEILSKTLLSRTDTTQIYRIGAGENRNDLVERSLTQNLCGLENLISIPGTVGAAPIQNIGAYSSEAKDVIIAVHGVDILTGTPRIYTREQCDFGYRESIFKKVLYGKFFITAVDIELQIYTPESYIPQIQYGAIQQALLEHSKDIHNLHPTDIATAVKTIRASKLPDRTKIGTAGSFFKNPVVDEHIYTSLQQQFPGLVGHRTSDGSYKLSAGQLIDLSGLKGIDRGTVGTYHHHALVLIHTGGGKSSELIRLYQHIQQKVYEAFGVMIEPEVNVIV